MGASNRHGGQKLSRRIKVLFHTHPHRRDVYRHFFGVKKGLEFGAPAAAGPGAATPAPAAPAADAPKA